VCGVFGGVDKVEMGGARRFPLDITIVAIKTVGKGYANTKKQKAQKIRTHK
jgi:hypothetical protein